MIERNLSDLLFDHSTGSYNHHDHTSILSHKDESQMKEVETKFKSESTRFISTTIMDRCMGSL